MKALLFQASNLKNYIRGVHMQAGLSAEDGQIVADNLVGANLRGVDSHGVSRLSIYAKRLKVGAVNPKPDIRVETESDSTLLIDGDNGMGQIVGTKAMQWGIEKAKRHGAVYIGVKRSNHFGTGSFYIEQGIREGLITYAMSNAPSTMAPWGGIEPYFGTNPYAFGVPAGQYPPIIFDMATSVVARGKIILADQAGQKIPEGWAINRQGKPTTDAHEALLGTVLPFGGPKGYAISLMIDVMSGVMTGSGFGPYINNIYGDFDKEQNVGHFFQLIDVTRFMPLEQFKERVDRMISDIKHAPRAEGVNEIYLPGEIEHNTARKRAEEGIMLSAEVYEDVKKAGAEFGIRLSDYQ